MYVDVDNGKYTVVSDPYLRALRHGQPWRDLTGDNLVYFLAAELQAARDKIKELEAIRENR